MLNLFKKIFSRKDFLDLPLHLRLNASYLQDFNSSYNRRRINA